MEGRRRIRTPFEQQFNLLGCCSNMGSVKESKWTKGLQHTKTRLNATFLLCGRASSASYVYFIRFAKHKAQLGFVNLQKMKLINYISQGSVVVALRVHFWPHPDVYHRGDGQGTRCNTSTLVKVTCSCPFMHYSWRGKQTSFQIPPSQCFPVALPLAFCSIIAATSLATA